MSYEHQIGSSIFSIEANVIFAGLEGVALVWVFYAVGIPQVYLFPTDLGSDWSNAMYAIYGVYAVLIIVITGFGIEGLAGYLEDKLISYLNCYKDSETTKQAKKRIFAADANYKDFSRRRLRILVARDSAFCFAILGLGLLIIFAVKCNLFGMVVAPAISFSISYLFTYLWIDARKGLKLDIEDANENN